MAVKTTRKKTKVIGHQRLFTEDGDIIECQVVSIEERDANFHKIWLGHVLQALDAIGNQKIKVITFILQNLNKENQLTMTQRKIAEESGVSYPVVSETIQLLVEADFLQRINMGVYQVHPNAIFKGGSGDRMNVLFQYHQAKQEAAATITRKSQEKLTPEELGQEVLFDVQQAAEEVTAAVLKDTCMICGAELIERTRRDDGKKFMGCPNFKDANHNVGRKGA